MGDLNSRTQELLDYIPNESFDYIPLNEDLYNIDSVGTYPRNNMDPNFWNFVKLCHSEF